mmetsp:Transcript_39043/g.62580  ORF Transcript_39043/g.62580 Transcript_39043/m.62580 type:complete len:159 (-) Transcript_39043:424-900(-)
MKPELDAAGVLLIVVGVGTPESGKKFSEALPFPGECLFVDPERAAYRALALHGDLDGTEGKFFDPKVVEGVRRLFFTKVTGERIKERGTDGIKAAMKNYQPLMPPNSFDAVQQGGTAVFHGHQMVYMRKDEATADHAPIGEVMAAVAACDGEPAPATA